MHACSHPEQNPIFFPAEVEEGKYYLSQFNLVPSIFQFIARIHSFLTFRHLRHSNKLLNIKIFSPRAHLDKWNTNINAYMHM